VLTAVLLMVVGTATATHDHKLSRPKPWAAIIIASSIAPRKGCDPSHHGRHEEDRRPRFTTVPL